jgi:hypothetical protein
LPPWAHRPLPRAPRPSPAEGAVHVARGSLPWTTGTSSSPNQSGPLLLRHMAGFYSAVDTILTERDIDALDAYQNDHRSCASRSPIFFDHVLPLGRAARTAPRNSVHFLPPV